MKGVLFKPSSIKAIAEGRKTQTRRLSGLEEINKYPDDWMQPLKAFRNMKLVNQGDFLFQHKNTLSLCVVARPRYKFGEVIYVKEAWYTDKEFDSLIPSELPPDLASIWYEINEDNFEMAGRLRSPMFMMEWMARHFPKITGAEPQRLQEITEEDAIKEGTPIPDKAYYGCLGETPTKWAYTLLWDEINPKYPFSFNPWVWVYDFKLNELGMEV